MQIKHRFGPSSLVVTNSILCFLQLQTLYTQIVEDVHAFDGHIPCDANSRSEVVVPVHDDHGKPIGVLDIDSHREAHFDEIDSE